MNKNLILACVVLASFNGCATSECALESDAPTMESAMEVEEFCEQNRSVAVTCLRVVDQEESLSCSAINHRCNAPLEEVSTLFRDSTEDAYCVVGTARLLAEY